MNATDASAPQNFQSGDAGFTLTELLIALTIIGALAAIAVPWSENYRAQIRITIAIADLRELDMGIQAYKVSNDTYPPTLSAIPQGNRLDPWGRNYQYLLIEGNTKAKGKERKDKNLVPINSDFDLYSNGSDGKTTAPLTAKDSHDDIIRANNGGYYGVASNY